MVALRNTQYQVVAKGEVSMSRSVGRRQGRLQLIQGEKQAIQSQNEAVPKAGTEIRNASAVLPPPCRLATKYVGKDRDAVIVRSSLSFAVELD
ncbi:hypothetical protein PHSY_005010 [Pseudozyma hubeiensis SY62]|uniref:Uncharacterized protein n=1 Tax=Pseudozyma hubeiensis (strain SY62) TaxID=1305764 RepID=R9P7W6_PSEHS|nr:hypothetical protein PHSY_005010 [Pseudozyma hubeiensis SY62]GAC97424.1 hypothetical protein PHSY_005010 [Pseudozyma hubeiensis SY62]